MLLLLLLMMMVVVVVVVIFVQTLHSGVTSTSFTARCYAERGYEIACRLSVCPSVTFRYRDHIGWNTSNIISPLNSDKTVMWRFLRTSDDFALSYNFQGTHILGALRGHLCNSVASCFYYARQGPQKREFGNC